MKFKNFINNKILFKYSFFASKIFFSLFSIYILIYYKFSKNKIYKKNKFF